MSQSTCFQSCLSVVVSFRVEPVLIKMSEKRNTVLPLNPFDPKSDTLPLSSPYVTMILIMKIEPRHEISNNVVCATSKASDPPAHKRSLIRAFASRLNIL